MDFHRSTVNKLKSFYEQHKESKQFEIVYVSRDGEKVANKYTVSMPWLLLPLYKASSSKASRASSLFVC
jgi:hypothetical protein